jgi:hypothetical protein
MNAASGGEGWVMTNRAPAAALLLSLPAPAFADALLDRLVAEAAAVAPEDFAFTRSIRTEQRSGDKVERRATVERYDPARPAGQRWTLVSVDGRAPTAEEAKDYAKGMAAAIVPSYGRLARYFAGGAQRTTKDGRVAYRATKLPKGALTIGRADLSAGAQAEATVADGPRPYVERLDLVSTKPVRMMLVAKVERLDATTRYRLLPDGRPVVAEQVSEMRGSMMGRAGTLRTVATFSDHRTPVKSGAAN